MCERPQKLDLNEFYLAAQEYEPGTDEFTEVFETAVRMFPDDTIANLNAANAAMRRDYDSARRYLNEAKSLGLEQAGITLEQLEKGRR